MNLDRVHDIQQAYRNLVCAFSYPGSSRPLLPSSPETGLQNEIDDAALILALMLLDNEVGAYFHETSVSDLSLIQQLTCVRFEEPTAADFLFFPSAGPASSGADILSRAFVGNHLDPHLGATAIIRMSRLPESISRSEANLLLSGPGIESELHLSIPKDTGWWFEARNSLCGEFPLGVDLILYDPEMNVMALPRSTRIEAVSGREVA